jgi:hypothetical protein
VKQKVKQHTSGVVTDSNFATGFFAPESGTKERDAADIIAGKLYDVLRRKDMISRPANLINWAKKIRVMLNFTERKLNDILDLIEWYAAQSRSNIYLPVIASAETFITKYPNLVAAKERSQHTASESSESDKVTDERLLALYEKAMVARKEFK